MSDMDFKTGISASNPAGLGAALPAPDLDAPILDWEAIYASLYDDVRRIARAQIRQTRIPAYSPSSLVSVTWLRLARHGLSPHNRRHLLALVVRAMRFILVDEARRIQTSKRGDGYAIVPLEEASDTPVSHSPEQLNQLQSLNEALDNLAQIDGRLAQVVELRYFGGFTEPEIAEQLGINTRTVSRDWRKARAWLQSQLKESFTA